MAGGHLHYADTVTRAKRTGAANQKLFEAASFFDLGIKE